MRLRNLDPENQDPWPEISLRVARLKTCEFNVLVRALTNSFTGITTMVNGHPVPARSLLNAGDNNHRILPLILFSDLGRMDFFFVGEDNAFDDDGSRSRT